MGELDSEPRSVALVRPRAGLGHLLCTWPALRALRARLPRARITLITYPDQRPIVERMHPYVDELLPFPGHQGIPERAPDAAGWVDFVAAAREREFDLALQAYGANPAANQVTRTLGALHNGGFFAPGGFDPEDLGRCLPYPDHVHEIDRLLALMELLGAPVRGRALEFPVWEEDEAAAARVLERAELDGRRFAIVAPGASASSRLWGAERFATVADGLAERGLAVVVAGEQRDARLIDDVSARMQAHAFSLESSLPLGTSAAVLARAELVVCADDGIAHLAAALEVPSVAVFLSGDPVRWGHEGEHHRIARVQVECNPCPHQDCPIDHRCATRLTARSVLREVDRLAAGRAPRRVATPA